MDGQLCIGLPPVAGKGSSDSSLNIMLREHSLYYLFV